MWQDWTCRKHLHNQEKYHTPAGRWEHSLEAVQDVSVKVRTIESVLHQQASIPNEYPDRRGCNKDQTQYADQCPYPPAIEP